MRNPAFIALLDEIRALHESKNHDYATDADPLSNLRRSEAFGIPAWKGVLVRLTDKWSRVEQLASGKTPKHESLRDSLLDNAVYSLLCIVLLEEQAYRPAESAPATVQGPAQIFGGDMIVQDSEPFIIK
jgi:hypothetical protein